MIVWHDPEDNVAHHKKIIVELKRHTRKYYKLFNLKKFELHVKFDAAPKDSDGKVEDINFESATADADSSPEYNLATVTYHIEALILKNRLEELEMYARHELFHVVLSPYTQFVNNLLAEVDGREEASFSTTTQFVEETLVTFIEEWDFWKRL